MPLFPPLRKARLTPLIPPVALAVLIFLRKRLLTQQILTSLPFSLGTERRFTPSISDAVFIKPHGSFLFFSCACFPATDINFKRIPFVPQRTPSRTGGNARRGRGGCFSPICGLTSTPAPRPRRLVPLCVCVGIRVSVCIHIWICTEPTAAWQPAAGTAQRPASRGLDPQPISGTRSDRLVAGAQTVTPCWVLARLQYCS